MLHPALSHLSAHTDRVSSAWLYLTVRFLENLFVENLLFNLFQTRIKVPCFGEYLLRLLLGDGVWETLPAWDPFQLHCGWMFILDTVQVVHIWANHLVRPAVVTPLNSTRAFRFLSVLLP